MANYTITVSSSSFYDPEMGVDYFTSVTPSSRTLQDGDTLTVTYNRQSGGQSYVDITGFQSGFWNSSSNQRLYNGGSVTRTLLASSGTDTLTANFPSGSFPDRNFTITATSSADATPDAFSLGSNITSANRSTQYMGNSVTVSGISTGVTATISGSGIFTVNDTNSANANSSSKTVNNGDVVRVWITSSASYSTAVGTTLNIGGVADYWQVTTVAQPVNPQNGTLIPLGISSGAISMGQLRQFFGDVVYNSNAVSMSDLYKGGYLVPNLTQNSAIPTSGTISLSNFYNAYTSLFWEIEPVSKMVFEDSQGGGGTAGVYWNNNVTPTGSSDIEVGYGMIKTEVEYRFIITNTSGLTRVLANGVSYTPSGTITTSWGQDTSLAIEKDYSLQQAWNGNGNVTIEVRKIWNGTTYTAPSKTVLWEIVIENGE